MTRSKAYTEEDLQAATSEVECSTANVSEAARRWRVPRRTLQHRLAGTMSHRDAAETQMRLTPVQEGYLVAWIKQLDAEFSNPPHALVIRMAEKIAGMPVGQRWLTKFKARHPEIGTLRERKVDYQRIDGAKKERMEPFFAMLKQLCAEKNIQVEDIWNMDETGIATGLGVNGLVMGASEKRRVYVRGAGDREWISIVHAVSASGRSTTPVVIFKGTSLQAQWFPDGFPDWHFTYSTNGWTCSEIALHWLKKVFLPETKPTEDRWRLLILDGHSTHENIDFMWECFQNKVCLLFLPSHTSHVLQPLDLSVFGPLKTYYRQEINCAGLIADSAPVLKAQFISCYVKAYAKAFRSSNIKSGFSATGIYPFRPSRVYKSRQVVQPKSPVTETKQPEPPIHALKTPRSAFDVRQLWTRFQEEMSQNSKTRLLGRKIEKALDLQHATIIGQQQKITKLESDLEALKSKKRKQVEMGPNERFADIANIKKARDELRAREDAAKARQDAVDVEALEESSKNMQNQPWEAFTFNFQL